MSRLEEVGEEDPSARQDDHIPQLISPELSQRQHRFYQDDDFTSKTPNQGTPASQGSSLNEDSTAKEIIKYNDGVVESADEASSHYRSVWS